MRFVERLRRLLDQDECLAALNVAGLEPLGDSPFREQLHHDERPPFPLTDVVDRDDMGVTGKPRRGKRLPLEPPAARLVVGESLRQHFHGDTAIQLQVQEAAKTSPIPPAPICLASA